MNMTPKCAAIFIFKSHIFLCLLSLPMVSGFCPKGCQCDDKRLKVICANTTLDVLPIALNTRIKHIRMSHNKIRIVDASFQFYEHLLSIDLSSNIIEDIEDKSFAAQKSLLKLSLSKNRIRDISAKVFIGLSKLNYLSLRSNELEYIRAGVLEHLISLVALDLGENRISRLEPDSFIGNGQLEIMVLDSNELSRVPATSLARSSKLTSLDLSRNELVKLDNRTFHLLPTLQVLNLSSCSLTTVSTTSLANLTYLITLDLSKNLLESIPSSQLSTLTQLKQLNLSGNKFRVIGPHSLRELQHLQQLYISDCPLLRQVQVAAFHNNLDLREVDLSGNSNLKEIKSHAFPRILHLTRLSIAGTGLSSLPSDSVPWERLGFIDLSGVSLRCNCDLAWMLKSQVHGAKCHSPQSLNDCMVRDLSMSDLGCGPGLQTEVLVVGLGCIILVGISVITAAVCCICRHRVRHIATCTVSAREADYKSSYDNCMYLGKMQGYLAGVDRNGALPLVRNHIPHPLNCRTEADELSQLKPLCVEATQL
eukprot:TRINITY_DN25945_c0_g1_i1.p1 TRINITY_DN25945_c0_g1~~TRINITY_DN25945_c0_g1_i1.p1  ORF type:complete len:535 (-),score=54.61 TRINITY_DN25945_c0_g1_i1:105-1709(-)